MKPTTALLCVALAAATATSAQDVKPAEPAPAATAAAQEVKPAEPAPAPTAPMDKVSYFIGKSVASQFAEAPAKIDIKEFIGGVKESLASTKSENFAQGSGLGDQFRQQELAVDVDKLKAGMTSVLEKGTKPAYTDEELTAAMDSLDKAMQAKAQAAQGADPKDPKSKAAAAAVPMDKVSYFIGKSVAAQFAQDPSKFDLNEFVGGVKEALASTKTPGFLMGARLGEQFRQGEIAVDIEKLEAGIAFVLDKKSEKPAYTDEELTAAMESFNQVMQAKQLAKLSPEERAAMAKEAQDKITQEKAAVEKGAKFLAENGKKKGITTTASGLQYEILKAGDGPKPAVTDRVNVHYHGTLLDGKVFDSSVERGMPITFGVQEVIKGWTEALQLMPVGSKWRVFIPSGLAYGPRGAGEDIGPNEALVFDIELLGIVK